MRVCTQQVESRRNTLTVRFTPFFHSKQAKRMNFFLNLSHHQPPLRCAILSCTAYFLHRFTCIFQPKSLFFYYDDYCLSLVDSEEDEDAQSEEFFPLFLRIKNLLWLRIRFSFLLFIHCFLVNTPACFLKKVKMWWKKYEEFTSSTTIANSSPALVNYPSGM